MKLLGVEWWKKKNILYKEILFKKNSILKKMMIKKLFLNYDAYESQIKNYLLENTKILNSLKNLHENFN